MAYEVRCKVCGYSNITQPDKKIFGIKFFTCYSCQFRFWRLFARKYVQDVQRTLMYEDQDWYK
jgi:hypothetical protein